jgi:hypothetical protein
LRIISGSCPPGAIEVPGPGPREIAIEMTRGHLSNRGQLMDDHVRTRPANGLSDPIGIKRVRDHRHGAELVEHRLL